jgi:hypothetical protein
VWPWVTGTTTQRIANEWLGKRVLVRLLDDFLAQLDRPSEFSGREFLRGPKFSGLAFCRTEMRR